MCFLWFVWQCRTVCLQNHFRSFKKSANISFVRMFSIRLVRHWKNRCRRFMILSCYTYNSMPFCIIDGRVEMATSIPGSLMSAVTRVERWAIFFIYPYFMDRQFLHHILNSMGLWSEERVGDKKNDLQYRSWIDL